MPAYYMNLVCWLALSIISLDGPASRPTTSAPATQPTTRPEISPALRQHVDELIVRLGDKNFRIREQAQSELSALGQQVLKLLIDRLPCPSEEVNDRLLVIISKPALPALRVELASRLLATGDRDRIESAVYMLFEDPSAVCDLFIERTRTATGVLKIVAPPVIEQLESRKRMTAILRESLPRLREKNAEKAAQLVKMDADTNWYAALAALESAIDALADDDDASAAAQPQSQPSNR
jgi:hypothetical protein